jgi:hypothetical protein
MKTIALAEEMDPARTQSSMRSVATRRKPQSSAFTMTCAHGFTMTAAMVV